MVVVADCYNHRLALGDGTVWKHLGSPGWEPGQFTSPEAVAVTGAGALVVTDPYRVQVLTVDGAVLCVLDPTAVVGVSCLGFDLLGVALYPGTDDILVTDYNNHRVVALSWSPEVYYLHPACFLVAALAASRWSFLFCLLYSVWLIGCAGVFAVKAHNSANSTNPLGL